MSRMVVDRDGTIAKAEDVMNNWSSSPKVPRKKRKQSVALPVGVYAKSSGRYEWRIGINGKRYGGTEDTVEQAVMAREYTKQKYSGVAEPKTSEKVIAKTTAVAPKSEETVALDIVIRILRKCQDAVTFDELSDILQECKDNPKKFEQYLTLVRIIKEMKA